MLIHKHARPLPVQHCRSTGDGGEYTSSQAWYNLFTTIKEHMLAHANCVPPGTMSLVICVQTSSTDVNSSNVQQEQHKMPVEQPG